MKDVSIKHNELFGRVERSVKGLTGGRFLFDASRGAVWFQVWVLLFNRNFTNLQELLYAEVIV